MKLVYVISHENQVLVPDGAEVFYNGSAVIIPPNSIIKRRSKFPIGTQVGDGCEIESDVVFSHGTIVGDNVVCRSNVTFGERCWFGEGFIVTDEVIPQGGFLQPFTGVMGKGLVIGEDGNVKDYAVLGDEAYIGPYGKIGGNSKFGNGCTLGVSTIVNPIFVIGDDCTINRDAKLFGGGTIGDRMILGYQATIKADDGPVTIGAWGFITTYSEVSGKMAITFGEKTKVMPNAYVDSSVVFSSTVAPVVGRIL